VKTRKFGEKSLVPMSIVATKHERVKVIVNIVALILLLSITERHFQTRNFLQLSICSMLLIL